MECAEAFWGAVNYHVIARPVGPHPRVASLALRAIHLLAIPWIEGCTNRSGPKLLGIATSGLCPSSQ